MPAKGNIMLTRRALLRRFGAGALAVPLLESLGRPAFAQDATFPTRLVIVTGGQGTFTDKLVVPGTSPTDFSMGPVWGALAPYKSRLAVCGNINDATNALDGSYNGHTRCLYHLWSAQAMQWDSSGGSASPTGPGGLTLDQRVANEWAGQTAYDSLEFGVGVGQLPFHHKGVGQPLPPENEPSAMFERLFQDLVGADPAQLAARLNRRQSVLDAVKRQFDLVSPKVGAEDRVKLETHLASIEGLQQALNGGGVGDACTAPTINLADTSPPGDSQAQITMLAMALACDLTRVATIGYGDFQDWPWLPDISLPTGWHDVVHAGTSAADGGATLQETYTWFGDQLALLLAALDAIPEGSGTVLDHTLVLYGNVFSAGSAHSHTGKTYLLAGGGGGLVGGRNMDFGGAPHGELFTSILNGLGMEDESFGNPAFCAGPLAGVMA
jgi:hypothetical protein